MKIVEDASRFPGISVQRACRMIQLGPNRYYRWRKQYSQHGMDGLVDRTSAPSVVAHKILPEEQEAILQAARAPKYVDLRHRKLAYQLQDDGVAFVSPTTVYRVLKAEGLVKSWHLPERNSAEGEVKAVRPNEIWHTDITYIPVGRSHAYFISVLDGYSRYIVHHELCTSMRTQDVERVVAQALENAGISKKDEAPALISDNGVQLTAKKFQALLQRFGIEHRRTAVGHPESNGKIEVFHKTLKYERVYVQERYEHFLQARRDIDRFVQYYNNKRLHQGIDFVTPQQRYTGRDVTILKARKQKHQRAIARRKELNQQRATHAGSTKFAA